MKFPAIFVCVVVVCANVTVPCRVIGGEFSQMFVFGDSFSDIGNVYSATRGFIPRDPPYYQGRFSDGPLWVEHLADQLALDLTANGADPTTIIGNNFAAGGARVMEDIPVPPLGTIPSLLSQAEYFAADADVVPSDALYVVYGGYNDVSVAADPGEGWTYAESRQIVTDAAHAVGTIVETLNRRGATTFLVPNLADFGRTPESRVIQGTPEHASELSRLFNTTLADTLDRVTASLNVGIVRLDVYSLMESLVLDATTNEGRIYGITNIDTPIIVGTAGSPGAEPSTALFADSLHISAVAQRHLGVAAARVVVPEPAGLSIILVAIGFAWTNYRRNNGAPTR